MRVAASCALIVLPSLAGAADAAAPVTSPAGGLLQVFIGLFAVLLMIGGIAWVAKRFGVMHAGAGGVLQVVGSTSVGTRERIVVVEVGDSWLVVGVAPGSVNALTTLPKGEHKPAAPALNLPPFAARLQQMIDKRHGK